MKSKEILDANPKAASLIHDYYLNKLLDSLEDDNLPAEFKEFAREKGVPMENIAAMLEANPRQMLDFFDEREIYINITRYKASDGNTYSILDHNSTVSSSKVFNTRKEADAAGVLLAIELLEEKLNSLEKTNEDS
jgi:hypothetical protein